MSETTTSRQATRQPVDPVVQDLTPYQLTLGALLFPWRITSLFHVAAGVSFALIGAPMLAAAWAASLSAIDWGLQRLYRRWSAAAAETDSAKGLRRLGLVVAVRTLLLVAAPTAFVLLNPSAAGLALVGLMATTVIALAVAVGWTSRLIFAAMATPAVVAFTAVSLTMLGGLPALGVALGAAMLVLTLWLIVAETHRAVTGWSQANKRTLVAMAEMKGALDRSEAAERRLRVAIEITDLFVYEVDFAKRTFVSMGAETPFFEQTLSYDYVRQNPFGDVAPEHRAAAKAAWARYEAGEGPYRTEYRVRRDDGQEVWAFASAELMRDETGRPVTLVGALHNITERKRSELELTEALDRAEAGSRAKSEFLATMSHEIRTPLNGVLGMAQAMAGDDLSEEQRKRVEVIRRSGESLLVLLNGVLDLSKIEAGKLELEDGEVDIGSLARAALDAFSADAAEKGLELAMDVAPEAVGLYAGDPARVSQVLYNLVSNAVKFTSRGSVRVGVDRSGETLTIRVADTGIGISAEQRLGLFDKFVQADASTTRRFGGTGLGLAICQQLVAKMGGTIEVESEEGSGSAFSVNLPLRKLSGTATAPSAEASPQSASADAGKPLRLLAAEDNPVNRLVLQTLLEQVGIEAVIVENGEQALTAWRREPWDLILMDVQMPVMDGMAAAQAIRGEEAACGRARTPIVALTANVMAHQVEAYRAVGIDNVVAKPIELQKLVAVMEEVLEAPAAEDSSAAGVAG